MHYLLMYDVVDNYVTARTASPARIGPPLSTRAVMPPWPRIAA